jgi:hypothetical protein
MKIKYIKNVTNFLIPESEKLKLLKIISNISQYSEVPKNLDTLSDKELQEILSYNYYIRNTKDKTKKYTINVIKPISYQVPTYGHKTRTIYHVAISKLYDGIMGDKMWEEIYE